MRIIATGSALPKRCVTNDELSTFLDTSDEWIRERTGIGERHVLTDESLTQLAAQAARTALAQAGGTVDFVLCATARGDKMFPSLACSVAGELGLSCPALDMNAACCGFVYCLQMAYGLLESGQATRVLCIGAEAMSRLVDWNDRGTCVLFGDGAGAAIVEADENKAIFSARSMHNDQALSLQLPTGNSPFAAQPSEGTMLMMRGQDVYRFAVTQATQELKNVMEKAGVTAEDIDVFLLHQANARILEAVRTRLRVEKEKMPSTIERTGNTSAASVAVLLDEMMRAGVVKSGMRVAMCAFGAGLLTAAAVLTV